MAESVYPAVDTGGRWTDERVAVKRALQGLGWEPGGFEVRVVEGDAWWGDAEATVRFASPRERGPATQREVVMRWYRARDAEGRLVEGAVAHPTLVLVHSLHPGMVLARAIARGVSDAGWHVLVMELPGYGDRRGRRGAFAGMVAIEDGVQAVADARRAWDAVRVLPGVDGERVSLGGVSLGGVVAATAGGLDGGLKPPAKRGSEGVGYRSLHVLFAGGDLWDGVLGKPAKDAVFVRRAFERQPGGLAALRERLKGLEPVRLAHRLDPERVWLISAADDMVFPAASAAAWADAVGVEGLPVEHRVVFAGQHYTAALALPAVVGELVRQLGVVGEAGEE
ncbi:MAG: hypothetical protein AAGI68_09130 [Planctomycetota bacterium]